MEGTVSKFPPSSCLCMRVRQQVCVCVLGEGRVWNFGKGTETSVYVMVMYITAQHCLPLQTITPFTFFVWLLDYFHSLFWVSLKNPGLSGQKWPSKSRSYVGVCVLGPVPVPALFKNTHQAEISPFVLLIILTNVSFTTADKMHRTAASLSFSVEASRQLTEQR